MVCVTKKYQITIPRGVREELEIKAGDRIIFLKTKDGYKIMRAKEIIEKGVEIFKDTDETVREVKRGICKRIEE